MLSLLLAGGAFLGSVTQTTTSSSTLSGVEFYNHTLRGERILASEVVCRNRWGTPMLPDGKGGYSLIAPINISFIELSLLQPPNPVDTADARAHNIPFRPSAPLVIPLPE